MYNKHINILKKLLTLLVAYGMVLWLTLIINNIRKHGYQTYIFYLYIQIVTRQCFCFLNSQWGITAHDIPPQREERKLDILENISFLSMKQKHAMDRQSH